MNARVRYGVALVAGAALACAFAPLNQWYLALLCPALLMGLWEGRSPRECAWSGFWFGFATFCVGTSWLFISIHDYGPAPIWMGVLAVVAVAAIMAAYHALLGYGAARWLPATGAWRWLVGLPALWLSIEWLRGWFLSGFPWLSLGYTQTDTWLAGFAPVLGVYGISAWLLWGSGALLTLFHARGGVRVLAAAVLVLPWPVGLALSRIDWTRPMGSPVSVAILQGAVPQDQKWQAANLGPTINLYTRLNQQALGSQLIIWPEAALPELANDVPQYLEQLNTVSHQQGSDLVMGILRADDSDRYYDSIMTLAHDVSFYDKHHLVPFAEYFPVPSFVRSWLRLMSLPYSDFTPGADRQPAVAAGGTELSLSICYEDAYGSLNLAALERAGLLVNVTNDAWFGHSWARYQHFQIARMRAIEARRPLLRAANDGISAMVGPRGELLGRATEFKPVVLRGIVQPRTGLPPYARVGNWLIVLVGLAALGAAVSRRRRRL